MRVDDYRFYGRICAIFGILLLVIGIGVPVLTMSWYIDYFGNTVISVPYLNQGIALVVIGIILVVISQVLFREYRFRIAENTAKVTTAPLPQQPS